jgi:NDP-sugar pyrophosphorylase family protein
MIESIILADGEGTRLRTIFRDLPKPMTDMAGRLISAMAARIADTAERCLLLK